MKLAIIYHDTSFLHSMRLSMHFILAQRAIKDVAFRGFMRQRSMYGDFIIVDNGAPEGELVTSDTLLQVANDVGADEIILPDVLHDAEETIRRSTDRKLLKRVPDRNRMIVPQGKTWDEWDYCLQQLCKRCHPSTIGVPKHLEETVEGRIHALEIIWRRRMFRSYNVHLLGAARGFVTEMKDLNMWFVRSMDTALPIALSQQSRLIINDERVSFDPTKPVESRIAERNVVDALRIARETTKKCTFL